MCSHGDDWAVDGENVQRNAVIGEEAHKLAGRGDRNKGPIAAACCHTLLCCVWFLKG